MLPRRASPPYPRRPSGRSPARLTPLLFLICAAAAVAVAAAAWKAGTLTVGGAVAATLVGTLVLIGARWRGGAVLAAFFVSSNAISRVVRTPARSDAKGDRRDAWQVIANGGPAAASALLGLGSPALGLWAVTASLAAAAADTWATSLGASSTTPPRLFPGGRPVEHGASGGITLLGTLGGACGALLIATIGALTASDPRLLAAGTLIGFAGMLVDSAMGSVLQGRFLCSRCAESSEWPVHRCGSPTLRVGGVAWLNNDGVNLAMSTLAAALGAAAWRLWA